MTDQIGNDILSIVTQIRTHMEHYDKHIMSTNSRVSTLEEKLGKIEVEQARLANYAKDIDTLTKKILEFESAIDRRFEMQEKRIDSLSNTLDRRIDALSTSFEKKSDQLNESVYRLIDDLNRVNKTNYRSNLIIDGGIKFVWLVIACLFTAFFTIISTVWVMK